MNSITKISLSIVLGLSVFAIIGSIAFYYGRSAQPQNTGCGTGQAISNLPSQYYPIVSKIRSNSTFVRLEDNENYSFYSFAQSQASYTNGTTQTFSLIFLFACNENEIAAIVGPNNSIQQIYYIGNGTITKA